VATASSPTVWRRWLALELRRLRDERGLSQKEAGKACGWSGARLSYIENAQQNVEEDDLDRLLGAYQVPEDRWGDYFEAVSQSHRRGWWERYERVVPKWSLLFLGLEQGAQHIQQFETSLVPGLLQTPNYAEIVLRNDGWRRTPQVIRQQVELRTQRQAVVTRDANPVKFSVVLDECVLHRLPKDRDIAREQLEHLASASERENVEIRVLPFSEGIHAYTTADFAILSFPFKSDDGLVYLEHREGAIYLEEVSEIESYKLAFTDLSGMAMSPDESLDAIRSVAEDLTS
jgi:transcriptional regulator with XRE-family HTH domain